MLIDQEDGSHAGHGHNEYDDEDMTPKVGFLLDGGYCDIGDKIRQHPNPCEHRVQNVVLKKIVQTNNTKVYLGAHVCVRPEVFAAGEINLCSVLEHPP